MSWVIIVLSTVTACLNIAALTSCNDIRNQVPHLCAPHLFLRLAATRLYRAATLAAPTASAAQICDETELSSYMGNCSQAFAQV
jgi:hypothetical protein